MQTVAKAMAKKKDSVEEQKLDEQLGTTPIRIASDLVKMAHWICEIEGDDGMKPTDIINMILRGPMTLRYEAIRERVEAIEAIQAKTQAEIDKIKKKKS